MGGTRAFGGRRGKAGSSVAGMRVEVFCIVIIVPAGVVVIVEVLFVELIFIIEPVSIPISSPPRRTAVARRGARDSFPAAVVLVLPVAAAGDFFHAVDVVAGTDWEFVYFVRHGLAGEVC